MYQEPLTQDPGGVHLPVVPRGPVPSTEVKHVVRSMSKHGIERLFWREGASWPTNCNFLRIKTQLDKIPSGASLNDSVLKDVLKMTWFVD